MAIRPTSVLPKGLIQAWKRPQQQQIKVAPLLLELSATNTPAVLAKMSSAPEGLSEAETEKRLEEYGYNVVAPAEQHSGSSCCCTRSSIRW